MCERVHRLQLIQYNERTHLITSNEVNAEDLRLLHILHFLLEYTALRSHGFLFLLFAFSTLFCISVACCFCFALSLSPFSMLAHNRKISYRDYSNKYKKDIEYSVSAFPSSGQKWNKNERRVNARRIVTRKACVFMLKYKGMNEILFKPGKTLTRRLKEGKWAQSETQIVKKKRNICVVCFLLCALIVHSCSFYFRTSSSSWWNDETFFLVFLALVIYLYALTIVYLSLPFQWSTIEKRREKLCREKREKWKIYLWNRTKYFRSYRESVHQHIIMHKWTTQYG